jgi:hypothetical protein
MKGNLVRLVLVSAGIAGLVLLAQVGGAATSAPHGTIALTPIGTYASGVTFDGDMRSSGSNEPAASLSTRSPNPSRRSSCST